MTIIYRTTDNGKWGVGLGSNLSAAQVDNNFYELLQSIAAVVPQNGVGIKSAANVDNNLILTLTNDLILDPVPLPIATLTPRGIWSPSTVYALDDIFSYGTGVYIVSYAHTSAATFDAGANDGLGHNYYSSLFTIPGSTIPQYGYTGQVLSKSSNADYAVEWITTRYVPTGGLTGQVLSKLTDASNDLEWSDIEQFPIGGTVGQFLKKNSSTNYDVSWTTNGLVPDGGTTGQFLVKSSNADYAIEWATPSTDLTKATASITAATTTFNPSSADTFAFTVLADTTLDFTAFVSKRVNLAFISSGTTYTVTFGSTSFKSTGTLSVSGTSGTVFVVSFAPFGSQFYEVSRTAGM